jgi:methionyl-tRNA formyltransferase
LPAGTLDGTEVVAGDGQRVLLLTVQPEGRRPMDAADWRRGVRPEPGERLGVEPGTEPGAEAGTEPGAEAAPR